MPEEPVANTANIPLTASVPGVSCVRQADVRRRYHLRVDAMAWHAEPKQLEELRGNLARMRAQVLAATAVTAETVQRCRLIRESVVCSHERLRQSHNTVARADAAFRRALDASITAVELRD